MRFLRPLALMLLVLAALCCSEAQTASPNQVSQTRDNGIFTGANYTGAPYIFELIETQVRFEADGRGNAFLRHACASNPSPRFASSDCRYIRTHRVSKVWM